MKVVVLAGMGGGTGSGTAIDIANAVRSRAALQNRKLEVHGYFVFPSLANSRSTPLVVANTYSLLTELNHVAIHGNEAAADKTPLAEMFESRQAPFDHVYCVPAGTRSANAPAPDVLDMLAGYLALDQVPESRGILRSCRNSPTQQETSPRGFTLKKLGYASLSARLAELESHQTAVEINDLNSTMASMLDSATTKLLHCGCDRRTLIFAPRGNAHAAKVELLQNSRRLAAITPVTISDVTVVSEESGIAPSSLARGLERIFPGIAEAARRLHVRIDCDWSSLH